MADPKKYVTEERWYAAHEENRDNIKSNRKAIEMVENRLVVGRVFLVSTVVGLATGIAGYAAAQSDGWVSQVESLGLAVAVGVVGTVVSAIWVAIFNSRGV